VNPIHRQKSHGKMMLMLLLMVMVLVAIVIYFGVIRHQSTKLAVKIDGVYLVNPMEIRGFQLTDNTKKPFTQDSLKGRWTMMFFGFTNCGYVCPTTMAALNKMYQTLKKELSEDKLPQVVMVTVDPDRDTVSRMNSYVTTFNSKFIGARGEIKALAALEKQLHIAVVKIETDGKGKDHYTIDHSAEVILFNPEGKVQAFMSYPHTPEQMVRDYKLILSAY
jgi:protein SCO1